MSTKRKYYAVVSGRQPGIYDTWAECEAQVKGFKCQKYKSFPTKGEAEQYIEEETSNRNSTVECKPQQVSSTIKSATVSIAQGKQVTAPVGGRVRSIRSNPFKNDGFHISSSVLEMPPADYANLRVEPRRTILLNEVKEAKPTLPPTHLSEDGESVIDVDVLYQLEYDGASKGNPGEAGAGALLRHPDGTVICNLSVGLGKATNNVAEYRGLIAGLRKALDLGIQRIQAQGDSKLVTMQVRGQWQINNANLAVLCKEAKELLKNFTEFQIRHVDREYNSPADALANKGVGLPEEKFVSSFPDLMG